MRPGVAGLKLPRSRRRHRSALESGSRVIVEVIMRPGVAGLKLPRSRRRHRSALESGSRQLSSHAAGLRASEPRTNGGNCGTWCNKPRRRAVSAGEEALRASPASVARNRRQAVPRSGSAERGEPPWLSREKDCSSAAASSPYCLAESAAVLYPRAGGERSLQGE